MTQVAECTINQTCYELATGDEEGVDCDQSTSLVGG